VTIQFCALHILLQSTGRPSDPVIDCSNDVSMHRVQYLISSLHSLWCMWLFSATISLETYGWDECLLFLGPSRKCVVDVVIFKLKIIVGLQCCRILLLLFFVFFSHMHAKDKLTHVSLG
jgi:hypothetical protein